MPSITGKPRLSGVRETQPGEPSWELIRDLPVGIVILAPDGTIEFANPAAERLLDLDQTQILGRTPMNGPWRIVHKDGSPFPGEELPAMVAIRECRPVRNVVMGVARPAREDLIWLMVDAIPQLNADGELLRVVLCFDDISTQEQAEADLRVERDLLNGVMNSSVAAITVLNPQGQILFANASAEGILGLTPTELTRRSYDAPQWHHTALDGGPWPDEAQPFTRIMTTGRPVYDIRHAIQWPDGRRRYLSINGEPIKDLQGQIIYLVFQVTDITDRYLAEQALAESENRFRLLAENMSDLICLHRPNGRPSYVSPSAKPLLGYRPEDLLEQDLSKLLHPEDRRRVNTESFVRCLGGRSATDTFRIRRKNGKYIWIETLFRPIRNQQGVVCQIQSASRDVTEKVLIQQQLEYDALHDALTGLPNRILLMERLQFSLDRGRRRRDYRFAVLFMDLDRFKVVNDSLGHLAGDQLLLHTTAVLRRILRSVDLAARLGGDEFVLLLDEIADMQDVIRVIQRLLEELAAPQALDNREVVVTASIGVVVGPGNYRSTDEILRDADIAMYRAKHQGRGRYELFDPTMHATALARLQLENDLRQGIKDREFVLHYQPIMDLASGRPTGIEALVRWQHPQRGLVPPDEFIPVAEETGLILPLGEWILWEASTRIRHWQDILPLARDFKININLSVCQLREKDLAQRIRRILKEVDLPGDRLCLEITEGMLMDDLDANEALLRELKSLAIRISIDDFGTGYSSLSYLHRLPIDILKIDKAFISDLSNDPQEGRIAETIISLGRHLSLLTVAEGIETHIQRDRLRAMGCRLGQGYLFSRPLPAADMERWLEAMSDL